MKRIATFFLFSLLVGGFCASGTHASPSKGADCSSCHSFSNQPPIANAGSDQTVASGATVTLNGAGSSDSDDGIASYTWSQASGTTVSLQNANSPSATFSAPEATTSTELTFQLMVTDGLGQTSTDSCKITVAAAADFPPTDTPPVSTNPPGVPTDNSPPVANAGLDLAVLPGTFNSLEGFYSTDPDDGIVSYSWEQTGGPAVKLSDATAMDPIFQAPDTAATITFRLVVTDKGGLQSSDTCTVTVLSADGGVQPPVDPPPDTGNKPPVADAGQDRTVQSGSSVKLSGAGSTDPDDGIASYLWRQISGTSVRLDGSASSEASFTAPNVSSQGETLTFELTVGDKAGQSSSDTVSITVYRSRGDDHEEDDDHREGDRPSDSVNNPPVANAGQDLTVRSGSSVKLSGVGSTDPDDGIASYLWRQISGTSVRLDGSTSSEASFTAPSVSSRGETLTFELTVKDKAGQSSSDTVNISVYRSRSSDDDREHDD